MASESESKIGLAPGFVVDGRYRVVRVIDFGGTGVVHHVEHVGTGRNLALKTLLDAANEGRLEQEARAASYLRNPHAVRVVDMGRAHEVGSYIVMELLEGTNLRSLLDDVGQLPIEVAASIALQVCECLDEAHAGGIIHRDLKPGNIHLTPTFNSSYHVTVLDFGAVKLQGPAIGSHLSPNEDLTRVGSTVGTPFYMSLEQLRGNASVDAVSDVYSLSVVLYEMLAGTRPFQADTLGDLVYALVQTKPGSLAGVRPDLPPELAEIVMRGLSARREDRPQSARDVARALASLTDPSVSMWMRAPAGGRSLTGAMSAVSATRSPSGNLPVVPAPAPSRPGHGAPRTLGAPTAPSPPAPPAPPMPPMPPEPPGPPTPPPRPLGAPALQPPPRPQAAGSDRGAPALRPAGGSGALGAPMAASARKASSTSSEHSALTIMPAHNLPVMQEQPTSALPAVDPLTPRILPDLDLQQGPPSPAAGASAPSAAQRADPPALKRQDTPTEMFAQGVHDAAAAVVELPDLGDLGGPPASPPRAAAPPQPHAPSRPTPPGARPALPVSSDDDSTSVLDLDALKAASAAKAAANAAKTTPPSFGPRPTPGLSLPGLDIPPGTLPPGATDTMRLDIESPSGPLPLQKLFPGPHGMGSAPGLADGGLDAISLDLGLPEPPKPTEAGPSREPSAFDPGCISLADGRASMPGPASPRPPAMTGPQPQLPYSSSPMPGGATGPMSQAHHNSSAIPGGASPFAPRPKPAWQGAVDQGALAVSRSTSEAIGRFFVWFRKLNPGEQTTFVVCTVLGFLSVLMIFVYVMIY